MKKLVILTACICCFLLSYSQVIFKNTGSSTLKIAIGFYNEQKGWTTKGWFPLKPGEEQPLYNFNSYNDPNFYYCARIEDCDSGYFGNHFYYVNPQSDFIIANADKDQKASKVPLNKSGFIKLDLANKHSVIVDLHPVNLYCNKARQGKWQFYVTDKNVYTEKQEEAVYIREIIFNNGKPAGLAKDYYKNGKVRAEFQLASFQPDVYDAMCTWYSMNGAIEKQLFYQNGIGKPVEQKAHFRVVSFPTEHYYLSSTSEETLKGGHSRVLYTIVLPKNTVDWYYQFSSSQIEKDVNKDQEQFHLETQLNKNMTDTITLPSFAVMKDVKGEGTCSIYLMDQTNADAFTKDGQWTYFVPGSSLNSKSGIVQIKQFTPEKLILALENSDAYKGIYLGIQVVAVVANR